MWFGNNYKLRYVKFKIIIYSLNELKEKYKKEWMKLPDFWVRKLKCIENSEAFELIYSLGKTCQKDSKVNFNIINRIK